MTNPAQTMRMLVTYAICIPLAVIMGYTMSEAGAGPSYGDLFFIALLVGIVALPIFIKWHYPIMVLGLGLPVYCFFFKGNPPLWEVVVILSLGIAIVERATNAERRFIKVPVMTWPLLYTLAMVLMTAELTGGIGLHSLSGGQSYTGAIVGGGKKYLTVFLGIGIYFALTSRKIPKEKRNLYLALFFLAALPQFIGDLFPYMPRSLDFIYLLIPPSRLGVGSGFGEHITRLGATSASAAAVSAFLLAKYGLRGVITLQHPFRFLLFWVMFILIMVGGFRSICFIHVTTLLLLFFLEGLHRTRWLLTAVIGGVLCTALLFAFSNKLPLQFQRSISFVPFLKIDPGVKADAKGSKEWRENMWAALWPQVPQYLLLGKGYALNARDFEYMGGGAFASMGSNFNPAEQGLAISMDYHSGPLSTLMPFGIWGAISYLWLVMAVLIVLYRNYRYGDEGLRTVNRYLLVITIINIFVYFFVFGAYQDDVGYMAKWAGLSVALNWGVCKPTVKAAVNPVMRRLPRPGLPRTQPA